MQDIMVMAPRLIKLSLYTLSLDLGYVWEGKNDVIDIITTIIIIIVATESENSGDWNSIVSQLLKVLVAIIIL